MKTLSVVVANPVTAHHALTAVVWPHVKAATFAGHKMEILAREKQDDRSLQQNKFYWGVVLKEISEQARIGGSNYTAEAWHELFKQTFLGYEILKVRVAGRKRASVRRRLRSTSKLKVKPMSEYLEKVQAHAATELGVVFSAPDWMSWSGVDPETGEIL